MLKDWSSTQSSFRNSELFERIDFFLSNVWWVHDDAVIHFRSFVFKKILMKYTKLWKPVLAFSLKTLVYFTRTYLGETICCECL